MHIGLAVKTDMLSHGVASCILSTVMWLNELVSLRIAWRARTAVARASGVTYHSACINVPSVVSTTSLLGSTLLRFLHEQQRRRGGAQ